jgi:hypothetical protein
LCDAEMKGVVKLCKGNVMLGAIWCCAVMAK